MKTIDAFGYTFCDPSKPLEKRSFSIERVGEDETVVEVAGCGFCHTDISFLTGKTKTKHALPLILGHEISGRVIEAGSLYKKLIGQNVIVPSVLPCGECELCKSNRDNICQNQKMPGNDFHGGFASHSVVPGRFLCPLPHSLGNFKLSQLSVIADAVSTPYQSLMRSHLKKGDLAIVIGTGGIGLYMVQHAKNAGATVIAIDKDEKKLETAKKQGAQFGICNATFSPEDAEKEIKNTIRQWVKTEGLPKHQWKVFETSGTAMGQTIAFSLLSFAGVLAIVGFTMDKVNVRLSNAMAFDADIFGNWGCRPQFYPSIVKDVLEKKINILDNVEEYPLASINDVYSKAMNHSLEKRAILIPERS